MGIKTEDFIKKLPPKDLTAGIDWLEILDSFDPTGLEKRYINECARRNPYVTCYGWMEDDGAPRPVEERIKSSEAFFSFARRDLEACASRINSEGLTQTVYKNARKALIKAIGEKGAVEYNRREYERLGEEGRKRQADEYRQWMADLEEMGKIGEEDAEVGYRFDEYEPVSLHEKVVKIRKGIPASNGKPLTQREFAKYIGYPISKYAEAEKTDRYGRSREPESEIEFELLEKLVMICHANPYWLFDDFCDAFYAGYEMTGAVEAGDEPCVYVAPDVILKWIEEGKPRATCWEDGVSC